MYWQILLLIPFLMMSLHGMTQSNLIVREQYYRDYPQFRTTFQYDAQGREVGAKHYSATFNGEWGLHSSEETKFDDAGNVIFYSRSGWKYAYDSLYSYTDTHTTYNPLGKISKEIIFSSYNVSTSSEQKQKIERVYEYNELGCLTTIVSRIYFEGSGYYDSTERYETDSQCKPILRTTGSDATIWKYETDNSYSKGWYFINEGDSTLFLYEYYTNNLLTEQIYQDQERKTFAYNPQGSVTEKRSFIWRESDWVLTELTTNTYNGSNKRIVEATLAGPDVLTQPLRYESYTTYEYNEFGSVAYIETTFKSSMGNDHYSTTISFRCDGQPLTWVSTDLDTGEEYMEIFYYYSTSAVCGVSPLVSLFPNPTLRYLKINTTEILPNATLKIYNTSGQLVSEIIDTKKMFPIEVDLGDLTPGTYILKIESNGMILGERFVKK